LAHVNGGLLLDLTVSVVKARLNEGLQRLWRQAAHL
jgi:hypothetical protein